MEKFQIKAAGQTHIQILADFQVTMALETQNLKLDRRLVQQALKYFLPKAGNSILNKYGMYLVRLAQQNTIGCLQVTFQNDKHWWLQSVYIIQKARRKGHFTALFQEAVRLGKEKGVKSIKLYVESENAVAKKTYFKLGMKPVEDIIYSYDFVYGGFSLSQQNLGYSITKIENKGQKLEKWLLQKKNLFTGLEFAENDWNHAFLIENQGKILGLAKVFNQFTEWRFGLTWYIRQLYLNDLQKMNFQLILRELMSKIVKESQLKVGAIRILYRKSQNLTFQGGYDQHYDILQIQI